MSSSPRWRGGLVCLGRLILPLRPFPLYFCTLYAQPLKRLYKHRRVAAHATCFTTRVVCKPKKLIILGIMIQDFTNVMNTFFLTLSLCVCVCLWIFSPCWSCRKKNGWSLPDKPSFIGNETLWPLPIIVSGNAKPGIDQCPPSSPRQTCTLHLCSFSSPFLPSTPFHFCPL